MTDEALDHGLLSTWKGQPLTHAQPKHCDDDSQSYPGSEVKEGSETLHMPLWVEDGWYCSLLNKNMLLISRCEEDNVVRNESDTKGIYCRVRDRCQCPWSPDSRACAQCRRLGAVSAAVKTSAELTAEGFVRHTLPGPCLAGGEAM